MCIIWTHSNVLSSNAHEGFQWGGLMVKEVGGGGGISGTCGPSFCF